MRALIKLKFWFAVHRWTSLVCTLFILLLCITGLPLIFHDEIDELIGDELSVPALPAGAAPASLDRVVEAGRQRYPHEIVQFLVWDQDRPELIRMIMAPVPNAPREQLHRLIIDARTAQVLGEPASEKVLTKFLLDLHGELL